MLLFLHYSYTIKSWRKVHVVDKPLLYICMYTEISFFMILFRYLAVGTREGLVFLLALSCTAKEEHSKMEIVCNSHICYGAVRCIAWDPLGRCVAYIISYLHPLTPCLFVVKLVATRTYYVLEASFDD